MVLETNLNKEIFIVSTRTIFHPCPDVLVIKDGTDIQRSICNKKQERQYIKRHPICIYDSDRGGSCLITLVPPLVATALGFIFLGSVGFNVYSLIRTIGSPLPPHPVTLIPLMAEHLPARGGGEY